jgi:YidC/Oxa1 family membrane protein insertase
MILLTANIFQPLIDVFQSVLIFFHNTLGGSWGWSIVLLTISVRAVMIPLTLKQFKSMRALQTLQPELKAIQNKYKDDKQRQQQELMKFYKENKVNPLGSCLPLVAQLPVFISLFYMLRRSLRIDICPQAQPSVLVHGVKVFSTAHTVPCGPNNGAQFLFIPDLTNKASGVVLVVLILLYVGTQLASSLMMSSPTMDKTQRQIMLFMPLLFVFFVINFPAGVLVYWITTNTWTIAQQYVVKRRLGPVVAPVVTAEAVASNGGGGTGGGGASGRGGRSSGGGSSGASTKKASAEPAAAGNGAAAGGIGALIRSKVRPDKEAAAVAVTAERPSGPPPRPPKKKKKRSGRKR